VAEGKKVTEKDGMSVVLTPVQQSIVTMPWDTKTLVTAEAGAGKTTTLAYRIEHLVRVGDLAADEILALTFSRAAVRELRNRVDDLDASVRRVRAQTFDSWARLLLLQIDPQRDDLARTSFDRRIKLATEAIDDGVMDEPELIRPRHVLLDEVQDLVGVRREMVEALIDRYSPSSGFTVVGDIAQSIYGFQVSDPRERSDETNLFLKWIRNSFDGELSEFVLAENFRARTREARVALPFGEPLRMLPQNSAEADAEAKDIHNELRSTLFEAPCFGNPADPFVQNSLRQFDGTTAILCRDNGEVLALSEQLSEFGIPHRIQRSSRERPAPAWIAGLLSATHSTTLTEERFVEISTTLTMPDDMDILRVWQSLRHAAPHPRNQLNLEALLRAVAEERLPDELTAPPAHPLVVSTVHRAKGMEFDRVLIVEPEALPGRRGLETDPQAEARLLYVAMTRPRYDMYRIDKPDTRSLRKSKSVDRWFVGGYQHWVRKAVEVRELDVCHEKPAGVDTRTGPVVAQKHMAEVIRPGHRIDLIRLHDLPGLSTETPPYGVFHGHQMIGEVSARFRSDLWQLLKTSASHRPERFPYRVVGVHVDSVETVAGSPAISQRHGLGDRGVWLSPRLCGLGRFDWSHAQSVPEGHINL
jgi:DNA helicase II / ATP-dependent DNA helicase PcrA